ncbi:MAG: winged helix-turn-helix transcriptional regulator [Chlamydiales bacterium]|nr:winged helix-turn-helix transcriptional regulator [Chlamydiales bacterium]
MLKALFGNRNVERILLFLFVNERCYGTQLQSLLGVPLTPIQKALLRLEKEGIVSSYYEGKTRIFQLNAACPIRPELEMLLKKAYTLLPSLEKKRYCFIHKPRLRLEEEGKRERDRRSELSAFWQKLTSVHLLSFSAKARHGEEQSVKVGKAEVVVNSPTSNTLVFQEKGYWLVDQIPTTAFSSSFRWTLDLSASLITLEHLRYGATHPVFLLHLAPTEPFLLESVDAHLCSGDCYLGNIVWSPNAIQLHWRIIGPHKNDELTYHYS